MGALSKYSSLALLLALLLTPLGDWVSLAQAHDVQTIKAIIYASDFIALDMAQSGGGQLLVDYGGFSLWKLTRDQSQRLAGRNGVSIPLDIDRIWLRGGLSIETQSGELPPIARTLSQTRSEAPQLWLVQFVGPVMGEWLDELERLGLQTVIYMPNNAYVVWGNGDSLNRLDARVRKGLPFQWQGAYHPAYRLSPALRGMANNQGSEWVDVTVQLFRTSEATQSLAALVEMGGVVYSYPEEILSFTNISLQLPANRLEEVARWADVFNIEPWAEPRLLDEAQNMIIAGQVSIAGGNVVPTGPGFLTWLDSKGFPTTPASYPLVAVVDDGVDQGIASAVLHPDFHELGELANPDRVIFINNCTTDAGGNGQSGHGNINAGIIGAYNNLNGAPYVDANGYRIGLGVSPYVRLGSTKVVTNSGAWSIVNCGGTYSGVVGAAYNAGATMTSNSWGSYSSGVYNASSQAYDAMTRDASSAITGNQQMLHVFSAGNSGPNAITINSPGTAKNVLTVGATENVRAEGVFDRCDISAANNADDIATFSSRGPTYDLRIKPDLLAPGTHVQGPASQDPGYNGSRVCGYGSTAPYNYPAGQSLYTWSSGTSLSAPAVAGAASLTYEYYGRVLSPGDVPSPAMLKALLLNTTRYLSGLGTGDTLPSNNQGWGGVNLGLLFDETPRMLYDQLPGDVLGGTGEMRAFTGWVADSTQPFRVTLAWTDAPGTTTGNAYVNNLDLVVTVGGQTYLGNVFSGASSITGGTADIRNNVESVFLPAGVSGIFSVNVVASNISGDGVPGNGDTTDQDFALVISNAETLPVAVLTGTGHELTQVTGNSDGVVDPGETYDVQISLLNEGGATATAVVGTLVGQSGEVVIDQGVSNYPDIPAGATQSNTTLYRFTVGENQICGQALSLRLTVAYDGNQSTIYDFNVGVGEAVPGLPVIYPATDVPKSIPDNNPGGVNSVLDIFTGGSIYDVNVQIGNVTHTYDGDLIFRLTSPDGTTLVLINQRGGSGDNFLNTVLDDNGPHPIGLGVAPFSGTFRPEEPLRLFISQAQTGSWTLNIADVATQDTGTLFAWSLIITSLDVVCNPYSGENHAPDLAPIGNHSGDEGSLISFRAVATDPDPGQNLIFSLDPGAPDGATIDPSSGEFSWTPSEAQGPAIYDLTIRVTDDGTPPQDDFETLQVTVSEINSAPVVAAIADQTVQELTLLSFSVTATDGDLPANTLTYSLLPGAPSGATIQAETGLFGWTPDELQGPGFYTITVLVTDNGLPSLAGMDTFVVTVTEVLAVQAGANQQVVEGDEVQFSAASGEPDITEITWDFGDGSTASGALAAKHAYADNGVYMATVTIRDSAGNTGQDSLAVSVANAAPNLTFLPAMAVLVGQPFEMAVVYTDAGSADTHTVTVEWSPGESQNYPVNAGIGQVVVGHNYAAAGVYNVTVMVTDKDGAWAVQMFTITARAQALQHEAFLPLIVR